MLLLFRSFLFFVFSLLVFKSIGQTPGCTQLSSPANGMTDVPVNSSFEWEPAENVTEYVLIAGTTFGGNDILNSVSVGDTTQYEFSDDLPSGQIIYVAIITLNFLGANGSCPQVQFKTESSNSLPSCAVPTSPEHAAQDVSITPKLQWQAVEAADGYLLTIATTSGDPPLLNRADVGDVNSFISPSLAQNTTYYFSVVPYNATGTAENCGVQSSFTTMGVIETPVLPCTKLLVSQNKTETNGAEVELNWIGIVDAEGYLISVGTDSNPEEFLNRLYVGDVKTYEIEQELPPATKINVLIIPYSTSFEAENCSVFSFITNGIGREITNTIVPHFFTPNNDGVNDRWSVSSSVGFDIKCISVFNRYGNLLAKLSPSQEWDGSINGRNLPSGSYWYSISLANSSSNLRGYFLLKR